MATYQICLVILAVILYQVLVSVQKPKICTDYKRPDPENYPRTYHEFSRTINGTERRCWHQDMTPEYYDEVATMYAMEFGRDEPISKNLGCINDKSCLDDFKAIALQTIDYNMSTVALTTDDNGKTIVLGYRLLLPGLKYPCKDDLTYNNPISEKLFKIDAYFKKQANIYKTFDVDQYLSSVGLVVAKIYRNNNISSEILKDSPTIAKVYGFKVQCTFFTGVASQASSEKAKFNQIYSLDYKDLPKDMQLEGIEIDSVKGITSCVNADP